MNQTQGRAERALRRWARCTRRIITPTQTMTKASRVPMDTSSPSMSERQQRRQQRGDHAGDDRAAIGRVEARMDRR